MDAQKIESMKKALGAVILQVCGGQQCWEDRQRLLKQIQLAVTSCAMGKVLLPLRY